MVAKLCAHNSAAAAAAGTQHLSLVWNVLATFFSPATDLVDDGAGDEVDASEDEFDLSEPFGGADDTAFDYRSDDDLEGLEDDDDEANGHGTEMHGEDSGAATSGEVGLGSTVPSKIARGKLDDRGSIRTSRKSSNPSSSCSKGRKKKLMTKLAPSISRRVERLNADELELPWLCEEVRDVTLTSVISPKKLLLVATCKV